MLNTPPLLNLNNERRPNRLMLPEIDALNLSDPSHAEHEAELESVEDANEQNNRPLNLEDDRRSVRTAMLAVAFDFTLR